MVFSKNNVKETKEVRKIIKLYFFKKNIIKYSSTNQEKYKNENKIKKLFLEYQELKIQ